MSAPNAVPSSVTVLVHGSALATKRWFVGADGRPRVDEYGKGKHFEAHDFPVASIHDLSTLLNHLATEPSAFIIRGELIPGRDPSRVQRTKKPVDGQPPCFREVPRPYLMVDVDKLPPETPGLSGLDLSTPEGCEKAARILLSKMPSELAGVSVFWSLSASAGMKPGLSGHLWFYLDTPMASEDLTRWADNVNDAAGRKLIDPAVYRTVQPHYTANPLFDTGLVDPVALRQGFIQGARDEASLPRHTERKDGWLRKLQPLKDPRNNETHAHVRDACASFFCGYGPDHPAPNLLSALRTAVDDSIILRGQDPQDTIYTDAKLEEAIASGRAFAKDRAAQGQNLALNPSDSTPKATIDNIRRIITSSPEWTGVLGYNTRKVRPVLLRPPPFEEGYAGAGNTRYPRDYTSTDDTRLVCWLASKHQLQTMSGLVKEAVDLLSRENTFDPILDELTSYEWDGVTRGDTWLIDYCGVEDSRYARRVSAMWLIQGAARTLDPGCQADCVLCLEGEQGLGKSSAFGILAGSQEYFREGLGDIHSKDTLLSMQSAFIIELREMAGVSTKEVEAIKGFLDRRDDFFRPPYGERPESHPRRNILGATTNKANMLTDETGARRWWPVTCSGVVLDPVTKAMMIDRDGLREVRNQLWAEAIHRYRMGEVWHVAAGDPDFVKEQNARYDADEREGIVAAKLKTGAKALNPFASTPEINANPHQVTVAQVLEHIFNVSIKDQRKGEQMNTGKMLAHLGWIKKHTKEGNVWVPTS